MCRFNGAATWKSRKGDAPWNHLGEFIEQLQWSRDLEVAERHVRRHNRCQNSRFNGAATWKSRKEAMPLERRHGLVALQWSRDLEVAERLDVANKTFATGSASMEPRLGSRGKSPCPTNTLETSGLQWSRDLEVAERSRSPHAIDRLRMRLQWSRDLEVAESFRMPASPSPTISASMEPRLGSRGKWLEMRVKLLQERKLQWSRDLEVAERAGEAPVKTCPEWLQWSRDLEVAERGPRKFASSNRMPLQWSRDLEVAESRCTDSSPHFDALLQWSRDLEVAERERRQSGRGGRNSFNGAATWKSRKANLPMSKSLRHCSASMEPRLGSRGKLARESARAGLAEAGFNGAATWKSRKGCVQLFDLCGQLRLQWSRDLEVAERKSFTSKSKSQASLQWSRDLEVAESQTRAMGSTEEAMLQWSRDLEVAERPKRDRDSHYGRRASMEPRLGSRGKWPK